MVLEFIGVAFFSAMTYKMQKFAQKKFRFADQLSIKLQALNVWVQKLEISQGILHIPPSLYRDILESVEDAFEYDFNMLIEEYGFYYGLSPKMQTNLVNFLFFDFKK